MPVFDELWTRVSALLPRIQVFVPRARRGWPEHAAMTPCLWLDMSETRV
jgi:hypothetical protein